MKRMYDVYFEKLDPRTPGRVLEIPVGVAFASDDSCIFRIKLDAIPLNFDGRLLVHIDQPMSEIPNKRDES